MDNIIVILIIFAVANYFITGVRKKQAEEQKRAQSAQETQGRAAPSRTRQRTPTQDKPMPAHAFGNAAPPKPALKPRTENAAAPALSKDGYTTIQPRFEEASTSGEGFSYNDLQTDWDTASDASANEQHIPGVLLGFDSGAMLKGIIFSQILERPHIRGRRRT